MEAIAREKRRSKKRTVKSQFDGEMNKRITSSIEKPNKQISITKRILQNSY